MKKEPVSPTSVRIPTDLMLRLLDEADANGRSLSREIVQRLYKSIETKASADVRPRAEEQAPSVLLQIAADIRAMREMQERQQRPSVEVAPRTMLDMQARPSAQALRHTNGVEDQS